jgi:hypothetical protein
MNLQLTQKQLRVESWVKHKMSSRVTLSHSCVRNFLLELVDRVLLAKTVDLLSWPKERKGKNWVRTLKKTQHFTITMINWLMLCKEIVAVYSEIHTEPINTKCRVTYC